MHFRFVSILVLAAALLPYAAYAKQPSQTPSAAITEMPALPPVVMTYDVYVGGFHLVQTRVWFEEQHNAYHAVVKGETVGVWGKFFPWNTILETHGRIAGENLIPQEFYTRDEWSHKPKITKLHFDGKGGVTPEFDPPNTDKNREIVTDEQKKGSLDPITALLQILAHVVFENNCNATVPVFDGKRRFDIASSDAGYEEVNDDDYNIYTGKARLCRADFKMISGDWKDREHARFWQKTETEQGRDPFQIWLAQAAPSLPEMPVRMESGSIVGLIVVHLSSWRYAGADEIANEVKTQD